MSKSPSLRRIQADIRELALDPSDRYHAAPMENDMFEWHFTIRGADGTDFEGGVYHGRILLPPDYPYKPPHIIFLTPSGRFETNTKICLSFSAFHPELWQPAWGIRLILEALISFLPTPADGAIGAIDWSSSERKKLATKSVAFECPCCGKIANLLPKLKSNASAANEKKPNRFQKEIEQLQLLQQQEHQKDAEVEEGEGATNTTEEKSSDNQTTNKESSTEPEPIHQQQDNTQRPTDESTHQQSNVEVEKVSKAASKSETIEDASSKASAASKPTPPLNDQAAVPTCPPPETAETTTTSRPDDNLGDDGTAVEAPQPQALPAPQPEPQSNEVGLWDPLLQAIVIILSVICYLLVRKVQAVWDDLQALN